ncbi:glycosyltransferase family 2 protein [Prevotella sp. AGR2160]|uniref:glycosyltransferase family 2 protein n=1 Tax=Prevotella sp. AGR2160 TaxID=1280674 RepID=UPI00048FD159|nr:glycosyltransferase family 2 protein [Prevotella sp. AGR2160]
MITFTVITATYNAEKVLQRTLDSVRRQSWAHVEHLIIDGASKDGTLVMVEAYRQKSDAEENGHEIKVTSEPDKGLYYAMNKGIDQATGQYLVFLNAGDVFASDDTLEMVAQSVGEAERLPGVLYGDTDIVNDDGVFLRHRRLAPPEHLSWKSFRWGMLVCHQSFYALTEIAKDIHYDTRYRYSADVDWCIRIMKACKQQHRRLKDVHAVLTNFLDGGMTNTHHRDSLKERFRVMAHHYGYVETFFLHVWFFIRQWLKS